MKKMMMLFLLLIFVLTACKQSDRTLSDNSISNPKSISSYENFLNDLKNMKDDVYYYIKDIDGNHIDDLLILENTKLSVYTYEKTVKFIGEHDFITGTVRLFISDNMNYPGIFYFTVGGGVNHYGYMTMKEKKLSFEDLWEENFAAEPQDSSNRIKELSSDKDLISESKTSFDKNLDIEFLPLKS